MTPLEILQTENEYLRKRARAWKDLARVHRTRAKMSSEFTEYWYQNYRRAMSFEKVGPLETIYRYMRGIFARKAAE